MVRGLTWKLEFLASITENYIIPVSYATLTTLSRIIRASSKRPMADKRHDANSLRKRLADGATEAIITPTLLRRIPIPMTSPVRSAPQDRRLKEWRRIATWFDRLAVNFASTVAIAPTIIGWT